MLISSCNANFKFINQDCHSAFVAVLLFMHLFLNEILNSLPPSVVGDFNPNCSTLMEFLKDFFKKVDLKKISRRQKNELLLSRQRVKC